MNKVDDLLVEDVENDLLLIVGHIFAKQPPPSKLSRHSAGGGGLAIVWQTSVCNSQNSPYLSASCFSLYVPVTQQVQLIVLRGATSTKVQSTQEVQNPPHLSQQNVASTQPDKS